MTNLDIVKHVLDQASLVSGDFAEFGVFRGGTFVHIAAAANKLGRSAYAFDSFRGLDIPSDKDMLDGVTAYPKGRFDVGGPASFRKMLAEKKLKARVISGFIPKSLSKVPSTVEFAFAYVDLDHYKPTLAVLNWLWFYHMSPGGYILCDDWIPRTRSIGPTVAIQEFLSDKPEVQVLTAEKAIWWRR